MVSEKRNLCSLAKLSNIDNTYDAHHCKKKKKKEEKKQKKNSPSILW